MKREEAVKILKTIKMLMCRPDGTPISDGCEAIDMAIEALSADTVPFNVQVESTREVIDKFAEDRVKVVRCKDCKWYKKIVEKSKSGLCHYDLVARCLYDEDFCSHGERRER